MNFLIFNTIESYLFLIIFFILIIIMLFRKIIDDSLMGNYRIYSMKNNHLHGHDYECKYCHFTSDSYRGIHICDNGKICKEDNSYY